MRTVSPPSGGWPTCSVAPASSRDRTRSSPHPATACSSARAGRRPSRRPALATSSPARSPPSSRKAWTRARRRQPGQSPAPRLRVWGPSAASSPRTSSTRCRMRSMPRSEITIDLGAVRHNVRRLLELLDGSQLWAVVKADAYGHGAAEVSRVALDAGASTLCVATIGEGVALRSAFPDARILVLGPSGDDDIGRARDARLELAVSEPPFPEGVPLHLKLDTGMGRFGGAGFPEPPRSAVGLMSHLATADSDVDFANLQLERFRAAVEAMPELESHIANSAAALRYPQSRFTAAARCGVALY